LPATTEAPEGETLTLCSVGGGGVLLPPPPHEAIKPIHNAIAIHMRERSSN
jgi:hypothetical protein